MLSRESVETATWKWCIQGWGSRGSKWGLIGGIQWAGELETIPLKLATAAGYSSRGKRRGIDQSQLDELGSMLFNNVGEENLGKRELVIIVGIA